MREFTTIKLEARPEEVEKVKALKYLSFHFEGSKTPLMGRLEKLNDNVLIANTQGYYERISLAMVNSGTVVKLLLDRKKDEFVKGIVLERKFEKATRKDWKITAEINVENCKKRTANLTFTNDEKEWLELGFIPLQMEDKWFVYMENNSIHFLRSWTGIEFFSAQFVENQEGWTITTINISTDFESHNEVGAFQNLIDWRLRDMRRIMKKQEKVNVARNVIIGVAIADAVGVPVEFQSRTKLDLMPVKTMRSYGTYNQPKGTWSDDSSLTFCLADSLTKGFDLLDIAKQFIHWKNYAKWTPHGEVFDIGITTSNAIVDLEMLIRNKKTDQIKSLKTDDEYTNGNGSLMRIAPLYFYLKSKNKSIESQFETIWQVSALTHGHIRSAMACMIYLIMMEEILNEKRIKTAYLNTQHRTKAFFKNSAISKQEIQHFDRLIEYDIAKLERKYIKSDGYVMSSLEAAFWCLLNSYNYETAVLKAVNLGQDTDTTAAITGGLAGAFYGLDDIPKDWYNDLVKIKEIEKLCDTLWKKYSR